MTDRTAHVSTPDEAVQACRTGRALIPWSRLGSSGEAPVAQHGVIGRCLQTEDGGIPGTNDESDVIAVLAGPTER